MRDPFEEIERKIVEKVTIKTRKEDIRKLIDIKMVGDEIEKKVVMQKVSQINSAFKLDKLFRYIMTCKPNFIDFKREIENYGVEPKKEKDKIQIFRNSQGELLEKDQVGCISPLTETEKEDYGFYETLVTADHKSRMDGAFEEGKKEAMNQDLIKMIISLAKSGMKIDEISKHTTYFSKIEIEKIIEE